MSDVRKSVPAKVIASLLILVSVFSLCWQGMAVLRGIDYVLTDSWQDTWEFKELIREREDQLAEWFAARAALEDPGLAYLDQVRYETDAERIGAAMAQDQTSFRYRVLSQDGTKVLATNLAPGESLEQLVPEIHSAVFRPGEHLTQPWNSSPDAGDPALVTEGSEESGDAYYIIECGVPQELSGAEDEFSELHARDTGGRKEIPLRIAATCVCLVLSLACFAFLMWSSGHKEGVEGIVLTWQEKIYFDLYLIGAGVLFFILIFPLMEFLYGWGYASQESYENQVSATVVSLCVTAMTALAVRRAGPAHPGGALQGGGPGPHYPGLPGMQLDMERSAGCHPLLPHDMEKRGGVFGLSGAMLFCPPHLVGQSHPSVSDQSWDAAVAVPLECLLPAPAEGERGHRGRQIGSPSG